MTFINYLILQTAYGECSRYLHDRVGRRTKECETKVKTEIDYGIQNNLHCKCLAVTAIYFRRLPYTYIMANDK